MSQKRAVTLAELLPQPIQGIQSLKDTYGEWDVHPSQHVDPDQVQAFVGGRSVGLTPPASGSKTIVVMGKTFDAAKPEDYIKSFAIKRT